MNQLELHTADRKSQADSRGGREWFGSESVPERPAAEEGLAGILEEMPLEELEGIVENLRAELESAVNFVGDQEEELVLQCQAVRELEKKLKEAKPHDVLSFRVALANERERQNLLEATLVGQRRNLRKQEASFNQHWKILRRRQGAFNPQEYAGKLDFDPLLGSPGESLPLPAGQKQRQKTQLFWAATLSALGLLGLGAFALSSFQASRQKPLPDPPPAAIKPSPATLAVAALGFVEPEGEIVKLSAPTSIEGARVAQLLVRDGDTVKAGQVVAILDSRDRLQAALEQAQEQVNIARTRLEQVRAGAKQGDIEAQGARFQRTRAELEGQIASQRAAIASLEAQLGGERTAQAATVERIQAELNNAEAECLRYQMLYENGATSVQEQERSCLQQKTTAERLKEARATFEKTIATLQEQIDGARANLERTVATLQQQARAERSTLEAVSEVRPVDVEVARAELQGAMAAVKKAQADLDLAYIRAPRNGQILKVHTQAGEVVSNDGIAELGQTQQMYVRAQVYETDIQRVRTGQKVTVKSDGVAGDLEGTVEAIGLKIGRKDILGTDPVADADARVVEVKIRLTPEASRKVAGLANLQVNVIIDSPATL